MELTEEERLKILYLLKKEYKKSLRWPWNYGRKETLLGICNCITQFCLDKLISYNFHYSEIDTIFVNTRPNKLISGYYYRAVYSSDTRSSKRRSLKLRLNLIKEEIKLSKRNKY